MSTENQTLQQLLTERVTAFANGDRPRTAPSARRMRNEQIQTYQ